MAARKASFTSLLINRTRSVYGGENAPVEKQPVRSGSSSTAKRAEREQAGGADARAFMERMKARRSARKAGSK